MSYLLTHRQRIENLLLGSTGTTRTIASGQFHLNSPDVQDLASTAERRVNVVIGPGRNLPGTTPNELDSLKLVEHPVTVTVEYARTTAGGDQTESVAFGEQQGAGTDDAIDDRIALDQHVIEAVLAWYENWSGLTPPVIKLDAVLNTPPVVTRKPETVSVAFGYILWVQSTRQGSYT